MTFVQGEKNDNITEYCHFFFREYCHFFSPVEYCHFFPKWNIVIFFLPLWNIVDFFPRVGIYPKTRNAYGSVNGARDEYCQRWKKKKMTIFRSWKKMTLCRHIVIFFLLDSHTSAVINLRTSIHTRLRKNNHPPIFIHTRISFISVDCGVTGLQD